jgi:hypothetical protein
MAYDAVQPLQDSVTQAVDRRDPQKITDLIEQLDHDLVETKNASPRR